MINAIQTPALNRPNSFKAVLAAKQRQTSFWLAMSDPYLAKVSATAGFDRLLIDSEHAPNDVRTILARLQAVAPYRAEPIVRPYSGDPALIKRLLNIDVHTLLVPMVDTAEQTRDLVRTMRYPPFGVCGVGSAIGRTLRWSARTDYLQVADDETCLFVQVETVVALQNLEAICVVDGVDGVFIGPADLAASVGRRGNAGRPEMQATIGNAMRTIIASGKVAGTLISGPVLARHYLELGCTFVATDIDILLFVNGAHKLTRDLIVPQTAWSFSSFQ